MRNRVLAWAAVVLVVIALASGAIWVVLSEIQPAQEGRVRLAQTVLAIVAGTGGLLGLIVTARRQWVTEHDARERRITEIYTSAVDQLGSEQPAVQLGGIYALERLADDNESQRETIVSVLCAFLRMDVPQPPKLAEDATDEHRDRARQLRNRQAPRDAAISILRRRLATWKVQADLFAADLAHADLARAKLTDAKLTYAILNRANLTGADLARAILARADLGRADLAHADLARADLTGANLTQANLFNADLAGADLTGANLTATHLKAADLTGADLTDVIGYSPPES